MGFGLYCVPRATKKQSLLFGGIRNRVQSVVDSIPRQQQILDNKKGRESDGLNCRNAQRASQELD